MSEPQMDREIVVDAVAEGLPPMVMLERSDTVSPDVTSAKVFEHPDGLFTAYVTWTEYPTDTSREPFLQPDYIAAPTSSGEIALMRRGEGLAP